MIFQITFCFLGFFVFVAGSFAGGPKPLENLKKNSVPGSAEPAEPARQSNFLRHMENEGVLQLQAAITRYQKDDVGIDLIGAIHIGDQSYYDQLNKRFFDYDAVLYEMIGEGVPPVPKDVDGDAGKQERAKEKKELYQLVGELLGLADQKEAINYHADNFIHADVTLAEFQELKRQEALHQVKNAAKAALGGSEKPDPVQAFNEQAFLETLRVHDINGAKLQLVPLLAGADEVAGNLEGNRIALNGRNRKCFQVLRKQLRLGKESIGIFYGGGHLGDMERRLYKMGFKKTGQVWINAWVVPKETDGLPLGPLGPFVPFGQAS